jgi:hypothetical protein
MTTTNSRTRKVLVFPCCTAASATRRAMRFAAITSYERITQGETSCPDARMLVICDSSASDYATPMTAKTPSASAKGDVLAMKCFDEGVTTTGRRKIRMQKLG